MRYCNGSPPCSSFSMAGKLENKLSKGIRKRNYIVEG